MENVSSSSLAAYPFPSSSAVLPDGSLNVDLLSREIQSDLLNNAKYKAEDGMKKRAVTLSEF